MRPWMGAFAAAAAIAILPAAALADDGSSVYEFKLPNKAAADQLIKLGLRPRRRSRPVAAGLREGDDRRHARGEGAARGDGLSGRRARSRRRPTSTRLRAERQATIDAEDAAKAALDGPAAQEQARRRRHRARAARRLLGGRRRTLALDRGHHARRPHGHPAHSARYTGPPLVASWYDADGTQLGTGNLQRVPRHRRHARRAVPVPRHRASASATPRPSARRCPRRSGSRPRTATSRARVKKWVGNGAPQYAAGLQQDFNTHYVDPQEGYAQDHGARRASSRTSRRSTTCRTRRTGYQRKAQTCSASRRPTRARRPPPARRRPGRSAVVLTSQAWGQDGGNDITAQIVNPARASRLAAQRVVTGNAITVTPATDAAGAITSTAAQVVDAINANPAAATLVTAALYRTNTGAGVVSAAGRVERSATC